MKKIFFLTAFLFIISGCAFLQAQKENWSACKSNPECYEDALKWQDTGELVGGLAGSVVPGAAMPIQKIAGYATLGVAMLIGGHVLRKKSK